MSRLRITTLALLMGLPVAAASADEGAWGAAPNPTAPAAAQLGRPTVIAQTAGAAGAAAPAVLLERPRLGGYPGTGIDAQVRPASYGSLTPDLPAVFRGQAPDAQPLPPGPASATDGLVASRNWQRVAPDASVPAPVGPVGFVGPEPEAVPSDCGGGCGGCGGGFIGSLLKRGWCGCKALFDSGGCGGCGNGCGDGCACGPWDGGACGACDGAFGCGCGADGCCTPGNHFYVSAEYLLWWTKGDRVPPLITQGSVGDLANGIVPGTLGASDTTVLFGGDYNTSARSGGRLMAGWWFGDDHCLGIEGGGFFLGSKSTRFTESAIGTPLLGRPFFDTTAGGAPSAEEISLVNSAGAPVLAGTAAAFVRTSLYGGEANLRSNLWCGPCLNLDVIAGYRYLALNETLGVSENLTGVGSAAGFAFASNDNYRVRNTFNGGQVGFDAEVRHNRWFLDLKSKVAFGNMNERADLSGATTSSFNGVAQPVGNGGLLTTDRVGSYSQSRFAVVPEVGLNLGYNLTEHVRAFVGYDYLYVSNVARVGDQVNLNVNPNRFIGGAGPVNSPFAFHTTDYWAQGVNFGLEFRW